MSLSRIDTNSISAGAVGSADIAANAITSAQISANAITTVQIAANAITASQIAPGAIPPSIPTGTIGWFTGDPGEGWLEANGQIVSQVTYSDLYSKVGLLTDGFQTTSYVSSFTPTDGASNSSAIYGKVAYGNSTYVAGFYDAGNTNANKIYTSTDGLTWTARSFGWVSGMDYIISLIYTDKFIASFEVGGTAATNKNTIATSTDGITWTVRTAPSTSGSSVTHLTYDGSGLIVASTTSTANRNGIITSTDGITWTQRTTAVQTAGSSYVAYGNGKWVIAGFEYSGAARYRPTIQTSTDGITWTYTSFLFNGPLVTMLNFLYDKFYLYTGQVDYGSGTAWTSTDGVSWTQNNELQRVITEGGYGAYDSTRSLIYVGGYTTAALNRRTSAMAVSADFGATWQRQHIGADVFPTATDSIVTPINSVLNGPSISNYGGVSVNNGKIFISGLIRMHSATSYTAVNRAFMKVVENPYTYQTDTQFALPSAQYGMSEMSGPSNRAYKSSTVYGYTTGGQKLYIKT